MHYRYALRSLCTPLFEVEDPHMNLNIDTEADVQMLKSKWPDIESSWEVDAPIQSNIRPEAKPGQQSVNCGPQ